MLTKLIGEFTLSNTLSWCLSLFITQCACAGIVMLLGTTRKELHWIPEFDWFYLVLKFIVIISFNGVYN